MRNHLAMSQVAFRRDLDDPHVVAQFAHVVGTEELLKMLCLMTLVDVEAVSSSTLTPWKEELLWRLYVETYNHLTLGYGDELVPQDPAGLAVVIAGRPDDITEEELTQFLEGLPRRYLALFGLASMYRHVRLARGIRRDEVHAFLENHDDVWELTIVTLDKPFLFSNVAGVLSYFGMDIHRGQAMTTPHGLVLDFFEFSDEQGFLRQNPGRDGGDHAHARSRGRRLGRCAGAAARPRGEPALSPPAARAGRACTSTTSTRRSTRCSRSWPTTRRGCCTASAASSPSRDATSTWR